VYSGLLRLTDAYTPPDAHAVLGYEADQYGPERTSWSKGFIQANLPENVTRYISHGATVSAPSESLGYYFGGIRGAGWGSITTTTKDWYLANTLIEVDMSTMRGEQWSNNTLPDNIPPRAGAEIVWIPVGGQGALVVIGGITAVEDRLPAGLNSSQLSDVEKEAPGFMTSLPVYDIVSKIWYMQNTTGDGPGQLTEFCSVVAPAKDSSSFNIYIYGGYDGLNSTSIPSDDVWILSVPAFAWVKGYSGIPAHGRRGHKCERIYPDQMLVIGGVNPDASHCTKDGPVLVFNLNTLKFQNLYDPREWTDYAVPDVVTAAIGGNGQGGATKTTTFSDKALSSLFKTPYTKAITTYYPYSAASGSPGSTPVPTATPSSNGLAKWVAPVLGVVLGLIALSIIGVIILLYRRRQMSHRNSITSSHAGSSYNNRILNWVNGMPNQPSDRKTDPSVTSTEVDNETLSSPLVGPSEAAGQQRYEVEAVEKDRPLAEMATSYNFQDHPNYPRNIDFAYGPKDSEKQSQSQYSQDINGSQPEIRGLGLVSSPSTTVSPQSPHLTHHLHSNSAGSDNSNPTIHRSSAPSPYVLPNRPEDVGNRSPTSSPSPTSSTARSPDFHTTAADNATGGTSGELEHRPSHQRNVSSLSSNIYQLPSPQVVLTPDEDMRRPGYISGISPPGSPPMQTAAMRRRGDSDGVAAVSPEEGVSVAAGAGGRVERKKTAGKKSSFGEMLDEGEERK
jgi:Kelch motif